MTTEFQPGSSSTDVVSGAFALHLGTVPIKFIDKQNPENQITKAPVCQITFISTCIFSRSLPYHLSKGSSSCRRLLCGLTFTLRPEPSAGGCWYVSCPGSKSRAGNSSPVGGSSLNFSPLGAVRWSTSGLNRSVPAMASAVTIWWQNIKRKRVNLTGDTTRRKQEIVLQKVAQYVPQWDHNPDTSGDVTNAWVAGLASLRAVKFLLKDVTMVFFSPFLTSLLHKTKPGMSQIE